MLRLGRALVRPENPGQVRLYRRVRWAGKVLRDAWTTARRRPRPLPVSAMLRAWRHGFTVPSYVTYGLQHNDPRDYLPDAAVYLPRVVEGQWSRVLRDKALFSAVLSPYIRVPSVLALIARGRVHPLEADGAVHDARRADDLAILFGVAERHGAVILKPAQGMGGRGVHGLRVEPSGPVLDGRPVSDDDVRALVADLDDYIVSERLTQAAYAERIFPGSANTIRVITMQDPDDDHRPFAVLAAHRFGVRASEPTDNMARGGIAAGLDLDSGLLEIAKQNPLFGGGLFPEHPDTGVRIEGIEVPGWADALRSVLHVATQLHFLRYVGWDLLMTPDGPALLEGNIPNRISQRRHPYLADPRVRRFFEFHGVV